ncbi:MAG: hypothetical protein JWQ35_1078, partial [Bacteriovoracaceae bacterium]|nr:hypothetical protein [Bacteriovoracaceae bacterium]
MDPKEHPNLPKISAKLVEFVKELRLPSDGKKPIYVFISDDLYPDAYAREEANGIYVGVSFGMLTFAKNDTEIKFVIGHELEHRNSQIKIHREKKIGDDEDVKSGIKELRLMDRAIWQTLRGAEESEVDIRSVVNRLVQKGENPYVAEDFILRYEKQVAGAKRERYTQNASDSTRRQAIGLAISVLSRGFGKNVSQNEPTSILHTLASEYALSDEFKARKQSKIDEAFHYKIPDLAKMYWNIESNLTDDIAPEMASDYYDRLYEWRWKWLSRYIEPQNISDQEYLDYELKLHEQISKQVDEMREKVLGHDFKPTNIGQLDLLSRLESRSYRTSISDRGQRPEILEAEENFMKANDRVFDAMMNDESHDKIKELEAIHVKAQKRLKLIRDAYEGDTSALISEARVIHDNLSAGDLIPNRYFELQRELTAHLKHLGPYAAASQRRAYDLASQNLPMLMHELNISSAHSTQAAKAFAVLTEMEQNENRVKLLESFVEGVLADFRESGSEKESDDIMNRAIRFDPLKSLIEHDFNKGSEVIRHILEAGLDHSKTVGQAMRFFPKERPVPNTRYYGAGIRAPAEIELSAQIFEKVFHDGMLMKFLEAISRVLENSAIEMDETKDLSSLAKTLNSLEKFIEKIDEWNGRGLITGEKFREILRPSAEHFIQKVRGHFRQLELAHPDRALQSCLAVGYPRILSLTSIGNSSDAKGLMEDLEELAQNPWTKKAFENQFGFYQVENALREAGYYQGLPSSEAREAAELNLFKHITNIGALIGAHDPIFDPKIDSPLTFKRHRDIKERFGHWALDQPNPSPKLASRVIREEYHGRRDEQFDSSESEDAFKLSEMKKRYGLALKKHADKKGLSKYEAVIEDTLPILWHFGINKEHLVQIAPSDFNERILFTIATRRFLEEFYVKKETDEELKARAEGWSEHTVGRLIGEDPPFEQVD